MSLGRILTVDDEPAIAHAVSYALRQAGYEVETAGDGEEALERAQEAPFDLIVLDLLLPKVPGMEVCRRLRSESAVPILMLTAKDTDVDVVLGLETGADDYLTKPFATTELLARVRALLRRRELDREDAGNAVRRVGEIEIDARRFAVTVEERPVQLTPSEFRLLALLASEPGRVFSRRELLEHLWQSSHVGDEHAADVHISNLRRKLERDPEQPERIVTRRGFGYELVAA